MGIAGLIIGIFAIIGFFIGLIPFFGWFNWLNIPLAGLGLLFGILGAVFNQDSRGPAIAGIVLCAIAIFIGGFRLMLGGGIL